MSCLSRGHCRKRLDVLDRVAQSVGMAQRIMWWYNFRGIPMVIDLGWSELDRSCRSSIWSAVTQFIGGRFSVCSAGHASFTFYIGYSVEVLNCHVQDCTVGKNLAVVLYPMGACLPLAFEEQGKRFEDLGDGRTGWDRVR